MSENERRKEIPVVADTFYFRVCLSNLEMFEEAAREIDNRGSKAAIGPEGASADHPPDLYRKLSEAGAVVIIFAAFCLQALINDYGDRRLGRSVLLQELRR